MRTWIGTVKTFNGRYWRDWEVRVKASSFPAGAAKAVKSALDQQKKFLGRKVRTEQVDMKLSAVPERKTEHPDDLPGEGTDGLPPLAAGPGY